jgi:asparagine synthase (glutamine-hydrolysing)
MCGIAVAIHWPDAEATIRRLISGITHRGDVTDPVVAPLPDTAFCTRRLRIVDAAHAVQPQVSADGRIVVAFNGEIYNHAALRRELTDLGARFNTASDTEVLANALQYWGGAALSRLQGMYAFVALDLKSGQFVAARDPFGEKPLYLIQSETGFLFCSEIRPLLGASEVGDVLLLPPGYVLTKSYCKPFASLPTPTEPLLTHSSAADLDGLLSAAVESCLPPDLPFATFFSGGIDSTLVAHYARRARPEAPGYFLGGEDAPDYPYAARYAEQTDFDLRTVPFDGASPDTFACIDDVILAVESFEPSVIRPSVCYHALSKAVNQDGYRVVLVGEGADELFCGYVPLELTFAEGNAIGAPVRDQCLSLMNRSALQRTDRCTMRFQVEARSPFLDRSVVDYAFTLDAAALVERVDGAPRGKAPLRALYDLYPDQLPVSIRDRRKIPVNEGAGLDASQNDSAMKRFFEESVSDAEFRYGRQIYGDYSLRNKEEYFYLQKLAASMDISRVPHLKGRLTLEVPEFGEADGLKEYVA